jgi:uncharacterized membrane protein HdeD (DUF308 family)
MTKSEFVGEFYAHRYQILIRALMMAVLGAVFAIGSLLKADVRMMFGENAWLPLVAFVILIVGCLETIDAYLTRHSKAFLFNLHLALFDLVIGIFILFGLEDHIKLLIPLVAAFMVTKGLFRSIAAKVVKFPNALSIIVGSMISIGLGLSLWVGWPTNMGWYVSFCLSFELLLRGWALTLFALWLRRQTPAVSATS